METASCVLCLGFTGAASVFLKGDILHRSLDVSGRILGLKYAPTPFWLHDAKSRSVTTKEGVEIHSPRIDSCVLLTAAPNTPFYRIYFSFLSTRCSFFSSSYNREISYITYITQPKENVVVS